MVVKATDKKTNKLVAIKQMRDVERCETTARSVIREV